MFLFFNFFFPPSIRFQILSISNALLTLAFVAAIFRILAFPSTPASAGFSTRISAQPVWVEDCRIDQIRRLDFLRLVPSATLYWPSNRPGSFVVGIHLICDVFQNRTFLRQLRTTGTPDKLLCLSFFLGPIDRLLFARQPWFFGFKS